MSDELDELARSYVEACDRDADRVVLTSLKTLFLIAWRGLHPAGGPAEFNVDFQDRINAAADSIDLERQP
jgi:hypothetical protein